MGRMLGDVAPQIGNDAADDFPDAQRAVGNIAQYLAAASSFWGMLRHGGPSFPTTYHVRKLCRIRPILLSTNLWVPLEIL